jgi:hypothetical protein
VRKQERVVADDGIEILDITVRPDSPFADTHSASYPPTGR